MFFKHIRALAVGASAILTIIIPLSGTSAQSVKPLATLDQGADWTRARAAEFYVADQGSRIMPLAWMRALVHRDGSGFLDDALLRYNYLINSDSNDGLPIGFTVSEFQGQPTVGMTCAACHTREIEVVGTRYRVDGGPAIADFQNFLRDLNAAAKRVLADDAAFEAFAGRASEHGETRDLPALRNAFEEWHRPFDAIVSGSLPDPSWGPGRLDAISMIFNRVTGLDIGTGPDRLIMENIAKADAPTRYPFLWNAARQDKTQWPGFADNGNALLGLARNLGQVYGVFGVFHPTESNSWFGLNRNYVANNSANFEGLSRLEDLVWMIGPPQWPWPIDQALADEGKAIFNLPAEEGGCVSCHGIRRGEFRFPNWTWETPVQDVGTDTRQCQIMARTVRTGVMEGAKIPFAGERIGANALAIDVLSAAVIGAIIQQKVPFGAEQTSAQTAFIIPERTTADGGRMASELEQLQREIKAMVDGKTPVAMEAAAASAERGMTTDVQSLRLEIETLRGAFGTADPPPIAATEAAAPTADGCRYEARVLEGIWAAAPYLHNGSVPTLAELLKPADERVVSFKLGPRYDLDAVGLAVDQDVFDYTLETTGCDDINSGRSRCGHEYGTGLSPDDRRALLEYLKTL